MKKILFLLTVIILFNCQSKEPKGIGSIERLDPLLDEIISRDAKIEVIAEGFEWSEGPLWMRVRIATAPRRASSWAIEREFWGAWAAADAGVWRGNQCRRRVDPGKKLRHH